MSVPLLYTITVLIWGTTWIAIKFQLGTVAAEVSILYRFAIAAVIMFLICYRQGIPMRFDRRAHRGMALQGFCLFFLNYLLFYYATYDLTSGLVSVVFSSVVLMNVVNGRLFAGRPINSGVVLGGLLGLIGLALIFVPEIDSLQGSDRTVFALMLCIVATYSASIGNVLTHVNTQRGIPVLAATAWGMLYGVLATLVWILLRGIPLTIDTRVGYISSLIYLALFGSVIAFSCYLTLIDRIGADKASYAGVLFPVVALLISTVWENYHWSLPAIAGLTLILIGNVLVIRAKNLSTAA